MNLLTELNKELETHSNNSNESNVKMYNYLLMYISKLNIKIKKDTEQLRCAQYIYNQLQTTPWNMTHNFLNVYRRQTDTRPIQVTGVGDPSGCGEGFSCVIDSSIQINNKGRKKNSSSSSSALSSSFVSQQKRKMKDLNDHELDVFLLDNCNTSFNEIKRMPKMKKILYIQSLIQKSKNIKIKFDQYMTSSNDTNGIDSESSLVQYSTLKKIPGNHQLLSVALNSQINYLNTGINNSHSTNHPKEKSNTVMLGLESELLGSSNGGGGGSSSSSNHSSNGRFGTKQIADNNVILPLILDLKLTNFEKRALRNYCKQKEMGHRDPTTVSMEEIESTTRGIYGWSTSSDQKVHHGMYDQSTESFKESQTVHVKSTIHYNDNGSFRERRTFTLDETRIKQYKDHMLQQLKVSQDKEQIEKRIQYNRSPYVSFNRNNSNNNQQQQQQQQQQAIKLELGKRKPNRLKGDQPESEKRTKGNNNNNSKKKATSVFSMKIDKNAIKKTNNTKMGHANSAPGSLKGQKKRKRTNPGGPLRELNQMLEQILKQAHVMRWKLFVKLDINATWWPAYVKKIQYPICLNDILKKTQIRKAGSNYSCVDDFLEDVDLLITNCERFNGKLHPLSLAAAKDIRLPIRNGVAASKSELDRIQARLPKPKKKKEKKKKPKKPPPIIPSSTNSLRSATWPSGSSGSNESGSSSMSSNIASATMVAPLPLPMGRGISVADEEEDEMDLDELDGEW